MEMELAAARHGCKVCGKSFSSGRSLGGHMRSHLPLGEAAAAAAADGDAADELARASANGGRSSDGVAIGYGLRENPRKTRRLSDFAGDEVEGGGGDGDRKACRVCGKLFPSWRSLLGHMRGHASAGRDRGEEEDDVDVEEPVPEAPEAEMAVEAPLLAPAAVKALAAAPRRRRRSMRVAAPPPAPPPPPPLVPCGFDKEPEPEDVALCLLMLSRDTGLWSSPVRQEPFESAKKPARLPRSGHARDSDDGDAATIKGLVVPKGRRKRSSPPTQQHGAVAVAPKRTRYECPGCGKVFSSYQALGGHRASHKRINTSCSAPKVSPAPEPSAETYDASFSTLSPSASPDSVAIGFGKPSAQAAAVGKFECPVCFMVFSSGKELGGHKLSHLTPADGGELYAGGAGLEHEQHSAGFLDLNFPPAPPEEA